MDIKLNKLFFIISIFSIHLVPFANYFAFETFPILIMIIIIYIFLFKNFDLKKFFIRNKIIFLLITYLFLFTYQIWSNNIEIIKYLLGPIVFPFFLY